jgi:hypothetical protein
MFPNHEPEATAPGAGQEVATTGTHESEQTLLAGQ